MNYSQPYLDCSGFVSLVLETVGYKQSLHSLNNYGNPIGGGGDMNLLFNTDIVYRTGDRSGSGAIVGAIAAWNGHVMIVGDVDAQGRPTEFIHSSAEGSDYGKVAVTKIANEEDLPRFKVYFNAVNKFDYRQYGVYHNANPLENRYFNRR